MNFFKIILLNLLIFSFSYSSTFEELSSKLSDNSFKVKEDVINELIINYKDEKRLEVLLQNMLLGNLYFQNQSNEILFLEKENSFKSLFTNNIISNVSADDFSKVKINNKLRSVIKASLAKINLFASDENKRLNAAKNILENLKAFQKNSKRDFGQYIIFEYNEEDSKNPTILNNFNNSFIIGSEGKRLLNEYQKDIIVMNTTPFERIKDNTKKVINEIENSKFTIFCVIFLF